MVEQAPAKSFGLRARNGLRQGLFTGALFGLIETCLVYGTGAVPRTDVLPILALDLLVFTFVGLVASVGGEKALALALLLGPVALNSARGGFARNPDLGVWAPLLRHGVLVVLTLVALALVLRAGPWSRLGGRRFVLVATALQLISALGLLLRTVRLESIAASATGGATRLAGLGAVSMIALALVVGSGRASRATAACLAGALAVGAGFGIPVATPAWAPRKQGAVEPGPNVLLITLDTVRADHLSCYGYGRATTPRLDALARQSALFLNAYANSPYTLSSHASLFTGLLPSEHGAHPVPGPLQQSVKAPDFPLRSNVPTLAERLAERGYRTAGIAANSGYLSAWTGLQRGFQHYDCQRIRLLRFAPLLESVLIRIDPRLHDQYSSEATRHASDITDAAIRFLDTAGSERFFLFLNYYDPHYPYAAPPPYDTMFLPETGWRKTTLSFVQDAIERGERTLAPEEKTFLLAQYDGEIAYADAEVGRLLDVLSERGLLDAMLVIVTSDHGEFFGEHGLFQHERALYEEVLRVPLIVKAPGQKQGARLPQRVGLHQVPALVGSLTTPPASGADWTALHFPEPGVLAEYWTTARLRRENPARFRATALRALFEGPWKLVQSLGAGDELYDLAGDPREERNRLASAAGEARHDAMTRGLPPVSAGSAREAPSIDPAAMEDLRALGYLQ
jgi:arylsulfatase A-like enzyme